MKYGDTLRQRSIPEWGHYNIDYDYLKDLIKHHTTPGTNKAVSIPGQGESTERAFRETFLEVLRVQHDRINLFVRSKSGEIERRLDHISRALEQLRAKRVRDAPGARLPARTVERYAKIDADVNKTGEEIRSLSRFQAAQRTGFTKILKKYKRWTKDRELSNSFKEEISSKPDSLFQLSIGYLLDHYIDVLDALRSVFDADGTSAIHSESANPRSSAARISKTLETGDELDFDLALTTIPLGTHGNKAAYWVHDDHIVEVQVLLLQHMRLYASSTRSLTRNGSTQATPNRRLSSATNIDRCFSNDDETGLVVLDHVEAFAMKQNASTIGSSEEAKGNIGTKAVGNIRCSSSGRAAVIVCTENDTPEQPSMTTKTARMERNALQAFMNQSTEAPKSGPLEDQIAKPNGTAKDETSAVRQWLAEHPSIKSIAGAVSKRSRFIGLHNSSGGGIWATLDREVYMKDSLQKDFQSDDWATTGRSNSTKFPHAILEVRREGFLATSLIQTLDRSHLVERVRGFSLEAHALWTCCRPTAMSQPLWIPLLDKDIRKLPEPVRKSRRKGKSGTPGWQSQGSPPCTSNSNTSYDGQSSPLASRNEESSATSAQEFVDPPPLQAFRKKHRRPYADYPPPVVREDVEPEVQRYWNEYDNPEDEEAGYYIYVDPDAPIKYPGQELIEAWTSKTRKLFGIRDRAEVASLSAIEDATTDEEDTADESPILRATNYGTIATPRRHQTHDGYFSNLFHSLRDPQRDADLLNERRTLLSELEDHQHKTEMTKLRFYSTCLAAGITIDVILSLMTTTSRKKEKGVVDIGVLFGTIVTLVLCVVAVISMKTRRERLGWMHQAAVLSMALSVVALDVLLLSWVLRL